MIKQKIPCGCRTIDDLMCGGMPVRKVSSIEGNSGIGKSLLGLHYCIQANKLGHPALVVDTEGMEYGYAIDFLAKRFKTEPNTITVDEGTRHIRDVMGLFGINVKKFEVTDAGALKTALEVAEEFKIGELLDELQPRVLLLDSFSQFIKNYVEMKSVNLPRRGTMEQLFFGRLQVLAEKYDLAVIITHHVEGIDPEHPRAYRDAYSEDIVSYNTKYRVRMMPPTEAQRKKHGGEIVRVRRVRYDFHRPTDWTLVRIKEDWGFDEV